MNDMARLIDGLAATLGEESIVTGLLFLGAVMAVASFVSHRWTGGRLHASAIAIALGLMAALGAGLVTSGSRGMADVAGFSGLAILGGATLRDFAIVATASSARFEELIVAGPRGILALLCGVCGAFAVGGMVAYGCGYRDPIDLATIGGGAATYIVGPVTGAALGAGSEVIALAVATGLVKSILVMLLTPTVARLIGLNRPAAAIVFGGLMGTTSGVVAGLAATDPELVPYGALTSAFYTGLGCLLGPSLIIAVLRALLAHQ